VGFLDNMKIIQKIEKEYLQYRKNGGWISFLTFAQQWLEENKEIISKAIDKND
jgi:type IV secretory pathway VirB4 component